MIRPILLTLLLAGCATPDPTPALQSAALCKGAYQTLASGTEALVRRSNPPQATLDAFLAAEGDAQQAFDTAYAALLQAIGSMSSMSPQQIAATTNQVLDLLAQAKEKLHP